MTNPETGCYSEIEQRRSCIGFRETRPVRRRLCVSYWDLFWVKKAGKEGMGRS